MQIEYLAFPAFVGFIYLASVFHWPRMIALIGVNLGLLTLSIIFWMTLFETTDGTDGSFITFLLAVISSGIWVVVSWQFYLWFRVKLEKGELFRRWNAR